MVDPITATTAVITLGTFLKDIIELAQKIQRSVDKVTKNRRRLRDLTNEILHILVEIANLTRGREAMFDTPALLGAVGNLKEEMEHVLEDCRSMIPAEDRTLSRRVLSKIRLWGRAGAIEDEIERLREHANACLSTFTMASIGRIEQRTAGIQRSAAQIEDSTARIEDTAGRIEDIASQAANTSLRIEQTMLVNELENQVRLQRLQGMIPGVLLNTGFGQDFMHRTIEVISCDETHSSLEAQYLAVQVTHLIDCVRRLLAGNKFVFNAPAWNHTRRTALILRPPVSQRHSVKKIVNLLEDIDDRSTKIPTECVTSLDLGGDLAALGFERQAIAWEETMIQILHQAPENLRAAVRPQLASSFGKISRRYRSQAQTEQAFWAQTELAFLELAFQASRQSLDFLDQLPVSFQISSSANDRMTYASMLMLHSCNLVDVHQELAAISFAQKAVLMCSVLWDEMAAHPEAGGIGPASFAEAKFTAVKCSEASFTLAQAYLAAGQFREAFEAVKDGFHTVLKYSRKHIIHPPAEAAMDLFRTSLYRFATKSRGLPLVLLEDSVILLRDLGRIYPRLSELFIHLLYAYLHFCSSSKLSWFERLLPSMRAFGFENSVEPESLPSSSIFTSHIDNFKQEGGAVITDAIRTFFTFRDGSREWQALLPLIRNLFLSHCEQATTSLREVVRSFAVNTDVGAMRYIRALADIRVGGIFRVVCHSRRMELLKIFTQIDGFCVSIFKTLVQTYLHLCLVGSHQDAVDVAAEAIGYFRSTRTTVDNWPLGYWLLWQAVALCDMGAIPNAKIVTEEAKTVVPPSKEDEYCLRFYAMHGLVQARMLRYVGRNQEALRPLAEAVSTYGQEYDYLSSAGGFVRHTFATGPLLAIDRLNRSHFFTFDHDFVHPMSFELSFLHAELAIVRLECHGNKAKALHHAQLAVVLCGPINDDAHWARCAYYLTHALTAFSACLAAIGHLDIALWAAIRAVQAYKSQASNMVPYLFILPQELGANAFHSLSLRLAAAGHLWKALRNAERATLRYLKVVRLSPGNNYHLLSLARSLQNLAAILWRIGQRDRSTAALDDSIAALEEAVCIREHLASGASAPVFFRGLDEVVDELEEHITERGRIQRDVEKVWSVWRS
ncbi:hypothetical protein DFH09DRAFT_1166194 [Mycena vulgaris]|nr:hypothetical protein DFH09DRAFT_1166194 [Mycena vulgaris]